MGARFIGCISTAIVLFPAALALAEDPPPATKPAGAPSVRAVASIFPLADVVAQIGGDRVEVTTLLPPGQSPHGYESNPRQAEAVAKADLLVTVGLGLDPWAEQSADASGNRKLRRIVLGEMKEIQPLLQQTAEEEQDHHHPGDEHEHEHGHYGDPHLWLDPQVMVDFANAVAEMLIELDPQHMDDYHLRRVAYQKELHVLDAEYREALKDVPRREFVAFHSAFTYLAERYKLKQVAVFEADAASLGPRQLERVVNFVKANNVKVIFAEPQFPADKLAALAEQTGATVKQLDPLGSPDLQGRDSYLALMRYNLARLREALSE
jgi:zinc transport system substrate-binding protein